MRTEARRERILAPADASAQPVVLSTGGGEAEVVTLTSADVPKPPVWRLLIVAAFAASGLALDLWSKQGVFAQLGCPGAQPIWRGQFLGMSIRFQLQTTFNHGALWGMGQGQTGVFASLSFVAIAAIGYFLWNRQAIATRWLSVATGLLLAGTLGNLFDRLGLHGWKDDNGQPVYAVRDFLDFFFFNDAFHWATFNFADTYLVVGACMLVLYSFWNPVEASQPVANS